MNQKGFANIILVVVVVVLVGAVGYFAFVKKSEPTAQQPTPTPTQINTPISPAPTPTTQQTPPKADETQGWLVFTNKKYNYSFKHPQGSSVWSNQYATDEDEAFNVYLSSKQTRFHVETQDPEMYSNSPAVIKTMKLPLKEFAQEIWKQNKEDTNPNIQNKEVGQISQTTVGGKLAYQFTLTGSYHDERGGYVLEKKYLYLFVENNGLNFMTWLPADDSTARTILESLKFIGQ